MLPLIYGKKLDQPEGQVDQERWDFQFLPDSVVGFCLLFFLFVCLQIAWPLGEGMEVGFWLSYIFIALIVISSLLRVFKLCCRDTQRKLWYP